MLEIFAPYMLFISFLLTVLFNLWLISKNVHWIAILIANLLLILVMEFLNLAEYNFLNKIIELLIDFIAGIFTGILDFLRRIFSGIFSGIWEATLGGLIDKIKDLLGISSGGTTGGGGGGFRGR